MAVDRKALLTELASIVQEQLDVEAETVVETASFIDDLGADSLAIVELLLAFEERFGVSIPDEDAESLKTVGDALDYLVSHIGSGAPEASWSSAS